MKTLYIDVYFLINMTVDLLAVFFAVKLLNLRSGIKRIIIASLIGAISAVVDVFINERLVLRVVNSVAFLALIAIIIARQASFGRRFKFVMLFFVAEGLIGGVVYAGYILIDRVLGDYLSGLKGGSQSRGALIVSVLILLSIGVIKIVIFLLSSSQDEKNVHLRISACGKSVEVDALIDSGNLVRDPMNMSPVLFIKPEFAKQIFPDNILELKDIDSLGYDFRKRILLIPVTKDGHTHVMTGIRVDSVEVCTDKGRDEVDMTVAIDREGGTFGGYNALAPSAVIKNVT